MDAADWLRSLGLGQYEALFREGESVDEVLIWVYLWLLVQIKESGGRLW